MLEHLHIRDLALIEEAEIHFHPGLNVLSGETGGGKSLVIAALKLLRGERASATLVRHGAAELGVDAEIALGTGDRAAAVASLVQEQTGVVVEEGTLVLTRTVDSGGRSRVRVNGKPTTLPALREIGSWLLEIHGQGEARALARPEIQVEIVDSFARTTELRHAFAQALTELRQAERALAEATASEGDRQHATEFLRFRLAEMDELDLALGELAELEAEHRILANLDDLRARLEAARQAMVEGEPCASDLLGAARHALVEAAEIDVELAPALDSLEQARLHLDEAARLAGRRAGSLDLDPGRLAWLDERLAALRRGLARYGPSEGEYLHRHAAMREELERLESLERDPTALTRARDDKLAVAHERGRRLMRARDEAAPRFNAAVVAQLADLGMPAAEIRLRNAWDASRDALLARATAHGPAPLDILVRLNPGEPFVPLAETASGGELARIVLALEKCLADHQRVPLVVFDEIDAEIGGRLGLVVGNKLREVAAGHQILIVTHLPQVAAFADAHFKVAKSVVEGRTRSEVHRLDAEASERELAAMHLGEGASDEEALAEARRIRARTQRAPRR